MKYFPVLLLLCIGAMAFWTWIDDDAKGKTLPILGEVEVKESAGHNLKDTVFHSIEDFDLIDQDSNRITKDLVENKIYIADFFFTSCPTICPMVKAQMLRAYEKYEDNDDFVMLSHSIDVRNDSVPALKKYAQKMEINTDKWHLLTGEKFHIYDMAKKYFIAAVEDPSAPGGYTHSGGIALVDRQGRIRGIYDGTEVEEVDLLLTDIDRLLKEK